MLLGYGAENTYGGIHVGADRAFMVAVLDIEHQVRGEGDFLFHV